MIVGIIPCSVLSDSQTTNASGNYGTFIDGAHVISDMIQKNGEGTHPRIIMTEEKFARLRSHLGDGSTTDVLLGKLKKTADDKMNLPLVKYEISGGIRLLENCKSIQKRVAALALAYNIYGEEEYAERAYRELENAANFPDWNPYHFLDTGEMCTAFAIGYDWLYNWMDDDQREVLRTAMIEKGLNQVMQDYRHESVYDPIRGSRGDDGKRSYTWYENDMGDNWKFVCIGGTNLAALAIGDEPDAKKVASEVLDYGCKKAYTSVRDGYKIIDGSYIEGLGYWDYATYYLGFISSSLISATGTDYGIADYEGLRKSVDFVRYMSSNTPASFSFGDDGDSRDTGWAVFLWLGEYYDSREISSVRLNKIADQEFNYLDVIWINEDTQGSSELDSSTDWGSVGSSNASFRTSWEKSGLVAALHVGVNDIMFHGHFDLGSFYVESNGTRFFTDLGNEKNYELPNRRYSYRLRAEGHNTVVINPSTEYDQVADAECYVTEFSGGKNEAYAVTDLTAAYVDSDAKSVVRGLKMIKDKECVVVQDEISLNKAGEIYWFAHTTGQISVSADGKSAIVTSGSDKLWVGLLSDEGTFSVMEAELLPSSRPVPGQMDNSDYRKLAIHLTDTKDTTITVACIPLKNGESKPSWTPTVKSFSDWGSGEDEDPPVAKYGITVGSGSADKVEAEAGETVTITANSPAEGKEFDKWVVDSGSVTLSNANSATATFTMPEKEVKVTATYKDKPVPTYDITVYSGTTDKAKAKAGETITITANSPAEGKEFDKWVVDSGSATLSNSTASTTTFTMPAGDVTVTAVYKDKPIPKYTVTVNSGITDKAEAEAGETVTITAGTPAEGKVFDKWVVDSENVTLPDDAANTVSFAMPAGAVTVTATYKDKPVQIFSFGIKVNSGVSDKSEAEPGETVTITANVPAEDKEFDKWIVNSDNITLSDETSSSTTFTMPEGAAEVTATYKDKPVQIKTYDVTVNSGISDKSEVEAGETVTITAGTPVEGKEFDKWVVDTDNVTLSDATAGIATFTMPEADVTVTATYKDVEINDPGTGDDEPGTGDVQGNEPGTGDDEPGTGEVQGNDPGTGDDEPGTGEVQGNEPGTGEVQGEEPPAGKSTITFDLNGGTIDGETSFTVEAEVGSVIQIPETVPVRDGYEFSYYKGSVYYPGDFYTVTDEDHTLTAQWIESQPVNNVNTDSKNSTANTNDEANTNSVVGNDNAAGNTNNTANTNDAANTNSTVSTDNTTGTNNNVTTNSTDNAAENNITTEVNNSDNSKNTTSAAPTSQATTDQSSNSQVTTSQDSSAQTIATPATTTQVTTDQTTKYSVPSTKDVTKPLVLVILMILSVVGFIFIIKVKQRKKDNYYVSMK